MNSCYSLEELPVEIRQYLKDAKVFYQENYRKYVNSNSNKFIYIYDENYIIVLITCKKKMFKYGYFPIEQYNWNKLDNNESEEQFLNECIHYIKQNYDLMWINHSDTASEFNAYPAGSLVVPFGNYIIDLSKTEEEIWGNFHTKHRNSVRRAEKTGIKIISGSTELLDDFYILDVLTWKRSNLAIPQKQFYKNIIDNMDENIKIFVAYNDKEPQGAAFFYFNNNTCYYMFGSSCDKPETGSMELLHWKAILYMKEIGVKSYSFVGCRINEDKDSKYHGIQRFKSRFGGELKRGYLFKIIFNNKFYKVFVLLLKIQAFINKSKYKGDIIDQEIWKWS